MKKHIFISSIALFFVFHSNGQGKKIVDWINNNKITFQTCDPTSKNFDDLKSLGNLIKDKQMIGLGESAHGTKEFLQMKHRIFKYLAIKHGFTVFVMEDSYYQYSEINKYIINGEGDLNEISKHGYWAFNVKERYDLIYWMKEYNQKINNPSKKLKFFGMDSFKAEFGKSDILSYLKKVDTENYNKFKSKIELISGQNLNQDSIKEIQEIFNAKRAEYIHKSSLDEYNHASHLLTNIIQYSEWKNDEDLREHQMADNIAWYLKNIDPESKMIISCHNSHVSFEDSEELKATGAYIKELFGDRFMSIALEFNEGSFIVPKDNNLEVITLKEAPKGYLSSTLAKADNPIYFIDLKKEMTTEVYSFFKNDTKIHDYGGYFPSSEREHINIDVGKIYDGIIFIKTTHAYTPMKKK